MSKICPRCSEDCVGRTDNGAGVICFGSFRRRSDKQKVQRYRCLDCLKSFSEATKDPCYRQKKRQFNLSVMKLLTSGVSQRRAARLLHLNRKTLVRKFIFMGQQAQLHLHAMQSLWPKALVIEFDDLETFEHTKCKPLSVTLAVESKTRRILGFQVSQMPAKGHLARLAQRKYGYRKDERPRGRRRLFSEIKPLLHANVQIKSDQNPHYPSDVKKHFPTATHITYKGRRGCIVGQGELKKIGFDPLFSLNHTCAKLRADINRLFRRTWCTTKSPVCLSYHLALEAVEHNYSLLEK